MPNGTDGRKTVSWTLLRITMRAVPSEPQSSLGGVLISVSQATGSLGESSTVSVVHVKCDVSDLL